MIRLPPRSIMQLVDKLHSPSSSSKPPSLSSLSLVIVSYRHKPPLSPSASSPLSFFVVVTYGHKPPLSKPSPSASLPLTGTNHPLRLRHYLRHRHLRAQTTLLGTTCMLVRGDSNLQPGSWSVPPLPLHQKNCNGLTRNPQNTACWNCMSNSNNISYECIIMVFYEDLRHFRTSKGLIYIVS